jgi:hypothetical protein
VAVFALLVVGVVVAQTWMDWNDGRARVRIPNWARGVGLASVLAVSLTAASSFISYCYQESANQEGGANSWLWLEIGFLLCALGIIVASARSKRIRMLLILSGILTVILWIGLALS